MCWSMDWVIGCLIGWSIDRWSDRLLDWFIDWREWLVGRLVVWLVDWSIDWLIDWSIYRFIDWLTNRLIEQLIDWLPWVIYALFSVLQKIRHEGGYGCMFSSVRQNTVLLPFTTPFCLMEYLRFYLASCLKRLYHGIGLVLFAGCQTLRFMWYNFGSLQKRCFLVKLVSW